MAHLRAWCMYGNRWHSVPQPIAERGILSEIAIYRQSTKVWWDGEEILFFTFGTLLFLATDEQA